jgi:hypothetical protein
VTLPQADGAGPEALRAVLDTVFQGGEYRWVQRPHPFAFLARWWDALREALAGLEETHPDLFWVLFWALVGVLLLIFAHAAWVMVQTIRAAAAPPAGATSPAAVARGAAWYRAEARRLAAGGAYAEAMQADFVALVLELDARRVVRFHPSKTPNEYTYEAGLGTGEREAFRDLVRALYGYAFARRPCGPDEYRAWLVAAAPERYAPAH